MTKQDYLLAVINAMPDREMGRGIKAMVENNQLENRTIDLLVIIFKKAMSEINDVVKKYRVMEAIQAYERFTAKQEIQDKQDQADLQKLNIMLDTF